MKNPLTIVSGFLSYSCKLVIFEFQPVAHVDAKGQQGNGNFGHDAGIVVLNKGVVAADIDDSTEHSYCKFRSLSHTCTDI